MTEEQYKQVDLLHRNIAAFSDFLRRLSLSGSIFNLPGLYDFNEEEKNQLCDFIESKFSIDDLKRDLQKYCKDRIEKSSMQFNELTNQYDYENAKFIVHRITRSRNHLKKIEQWEDKKCSLAIYENKENTFYELELPFSTKELIHLNVLKTKEIIADLEKSLKEI